MGETLILPKDVKGTNRLRDSRIIGMFCEEGIDQTTIARKFKLSQPRICEILRNNMISVIEHRKDWEKLKRINSMSHMLKDEKLPLANNKLDVLKELRKEFEGEEKQTTINNTTYIIHGSRKNSRFEVLPTQSTADNT